MALVCRPRRQVAPGQGKLHRSCWAGCVCLPGGGALCV